MRVDDIKLFFEYNHWANQRILDAAERLTAEQLTAPNELGWGSIHGALTHILDAEYGWFSFLFDRKDEGVLDPDQFSSIAELRERWRTQQTVAEACLDSLNDGDLERVHASRGQDKTYAWSLWQALAHVVNHGTQHRSECAALLTGLGASPGDMDLSLFLSQRASAQSVAPSAYKREIELLFRYNDWANDRILARAEKVSPEQLGAPKGLGWGSLKGVLVHLMDAERAWRVLLQDGEQVKWLEADDFADIAAIRGRWSEERAAFWAYLADLSDSDLAGMINYEAHDGLRQRRLWHCLAHVVNHGTQHRSECAALLTGFGQSPGSLDLTAFLSNRGEA